MELYSGIIVRNNVTESYYRIILRNHIDSDYEMILWNYIMELNYGITLQNHIMRSYYGITLQNYPVKRNPWILGTSQRPPGNSRDLTGPLDPPATIKRPYLNKFTAPEALGCCIRICLLQRVSPKTPLDRFVMYTTRREPPLVPLTPGSRTGFIRMPWPLVPRLSIGIYIHIYI